jgi:hypothetical protein
MSGLVNGFDSSIVDERASNTASKRPCARHKRR